MVKISVIIPIYNQENYIISCAKALQQQEFTDFNVFFIDDGSTDTTVCKLRPFIEANPNFSLIKQENGGVSKARNSGLQQADGEWITFIDPDDLIIPSFLKTLFSETLKHPHADIIMSSCSAFTSKTNKIQHFFPKNFIATSDIEKIPLYYQLMVSKYQQPKESVTAIGVPWGKLYRRSFLKSNNIQFDPALKRMQDNLFNMQAFHDATEIVYIDYAGYCYRIDGTTKRSYRNAINRVYRPVLYAREQLMNRYNLKKYKELYIAQQIEKINLYFQEIRALVLLSAQNYSNVHNEVTARMLEIKPLVHDIRLSILPKREILRKLIMTHKTALKIYMFIKTKNKI